MGDASLSQEEIDALLMGADDFDETPVEQPVFNLDAVEEDKEAVDFEPAPASLVDISAAFNLAMQAASNSASVLVTRKILINNCNIEEVERNNVTGSIIPDSIIISISIGAYQSAFIFDNSIAKKISMYMMGSDEEPPELDDAYLSTLSELCNTILSSISNNLSAKFKDDMMPGVPQAIIFKSTEDLPGFKAEKLYRLNYDLELEGEGKFMLSHIIESNGVDLWLENFKLPVTSEKPAKKVVEEDDEFSMPPQPPSYTPSPREYRSSQPPSGSQTVPTINAVTLPSLSNTSGIIKQGQMSSIDIITDVQMILTVELGRTKKFIKDILGLGEGSIIELDKLAGEPVDLLVNAKLIAKGEVVVIDENFGVRVTDIVGPAERLARLTS